MQHPKAVADPRVVAEVRVVPHVAVGLLGGPPAVLVVQGGGQTPVEALPEIAQDPAPEALQNARGVHYTTHRRRAGPLAKA